MDADFAITYFNNLTKKEKERFEDSDQSKKEEKTTYGPFANLFSLLCAVVAVYLSWTCNSNCFPNMNVIEKVFRAFFAMIFGLIYLIIYFIAWSSSCSACQK